MKKNIITDENMGVEWLNYQNITKKLLELILNFRWLWVVFLITSVLSTLIFCLTYNNDDVFLPFTVSKDRPLCVLTSIFFEPYLNNLLNNLSGLFFLIFSFTIINFHSPKVSQVRNSIFMSIIIFLAAILSNVFWIMISEGGATGSSGVVFASQGVTLLFAMKTIPSLYDSIKSGITVCNVVVAFFVLVVILLILYSLIGQIALLPEWDTSKENVIVHLSSIAISFTTSFFFVYNEKRK
jgi:hypothetical protein